jgi:sec-independent protein translocase protein TatA
MEILSVSHWVTVLLLVFLLFGPGSISDVLGDFGKGVRGFRKGLTDNDEFDATALSQANSESPSVISERETEQNQTGITGRFWVPQS